ncbi:MAG: hypothetical protein L0H75_02110, partial [Nitrosospira sp.]|nr:hypothetical protein [Nitrosospira sp.]
ISTGQDKASEIRENSAAAANAIQDGVFDEESDHIVDANKMVDGATTEESSAVQTHDQDDDFDDFVKSEERDLGFRRANMQIEQRKQRELDAIQQSQIETAGKLADQQIAAQSSELGEPTAMQLALQKAQERKKGKSPDAPTPEPVKTLNAQLNALAAGNKPGMLLTPGEPMPDALPDGAQAAEIPGRGTLLYRDDAILQAALNGQMGEALGYGIDEKPGDATHVVTARDENGTVIQDVATDGGKPVLQAAKDVAGKDGSVEVRPVQEAMAERGGAAQLAASTPAPVERYQWMRNKEGGQKYGNLQEIHPLTQELFDQHIKALVRPELQNYEQYIKSFPDAHISLLSKDKGSSWGIDKVGSLEELRPSPQNPAWAKQVESFESPDAIKQVEGGFVAVRKANSAQPEQAYKDGALLPIGDLIQYYDTEIAEKPAGATVPNPRFVIGSVSDGVVAELKRFIDGYDGKQRTLRVSGRTIKHIEERRPKLARHIVENLRSFFINPDEVLPDHQAKSGRRNRALLVHKGDPDSKLKNYVATVEVEVEINGDYIDIVNVMTSPERSLREARKMKSNWPGGQQLPNGNSPHPVDAEASHAEADLPSVQPVGGANVAQNENQSNLRPLIESLIKRRAASKQIGKERSINSAIARAKEVMDGKRTDTALESKWFRVQAAGIQKTDAETAGILRQISEAVKETKNKPTALEQKKTEYNSDQGEFSYDAIQTRPGTTERQLEIGMGVYAERIRSVVDRANGSLLAASIAKDFKERGGAVLIGQTVESPEDLAVLAQIFRDPRFETFRIFFTKEGKIVHHTGMTSRLPASVSLVTQLDGESQDDAHKRLLDNLAAQRNASGADGYYLLHNHPSGTAEPSTADERLTMAIADGVSGFMSHVVIDTNEYGTIDSDGISVVIKKELTGGYSDEAVIPHDALRMKVSGPDSVAEIGKLIERKDGFFSVIGLSPQMDVVAIADVPLSITSSKSNLRLHAMLRVFARNSGAHSIAVVADDVDHFEKAINAGIIIDAVSTDGDSARKVHYYPGDNLFGNNVKSIQVKQNEKPFKERLNDYRENQKARAVAVRGAASPVLQQQRGRGEQESRQAVRGDDISESARIAEVRKRLEAASDKSKQATQPGGLSVSGWTRSQTESVVKSIASVWKNAPEIIIADSMADPAIPEVVRQENDSQLSQGAEGSPEGFLYDGKVYIIASEMNGVADVIRVLSHESFGHFGLRGLFREELKPILKQIAALRPADMARKAKQYVRIKNEEGKPTLTEEELAKNRLVVAEEVLAELAQTNPQISFVRRAIAAIRAWFRKHVPGFKDMMLTDDEIVHSYLIPAREFVRNGSGANAGGDVAFQRVWHGTPHVWPPEPGFPHGRPRLDRMGTGEGAQAFGWGWYSAENQGIAKGYHEALAPITRSHVAFAGQKITPKILADLQNSSDPDIADFFKYEYTPKFYTPKKVMPWLDEKIANAKAEQAKFEQRAEERKNTEVIAATYSIEQLQELADQQGKKAARLQKIKDLHESIPDQRGGSLYSLDIPDSTLPYLLDWDRTMSEQAPEVQKALAGLSDKVIDAWKTNGAWPHIKGETLYRHLADGLTNAAGRDGKHKAASELLASIGIVGNRYLDGGSRARGEGAYNYVLWDQPTLDKIAMLERNGAALDAIREADAAFSRQPDAAISEIVARFTEKVREAVKAGNEENRQPILVAEDTPASLQVLGFKNLPVVARAGNDGILKMFYDHGMTAEQIGRLIPETLKRPAFMFQHKGKGEFDSIMFVAQEERSGKPIIIAVHPERKGRAATGDVQLVATMLAKDQGWTYVQAQIMAGNLLYRDTNSVLAGKAGGAVAAAQKRYAREPRSLLGLIPNRAPVRGRAYKVLSQSDLVKSEKETWGNEPLFSRQSQTETPEFKKWFAGSKVVDEDGKPLVVYHGTNKDVKSFRVKNRGLAYYFTPDPDQASSYAGRQGANVIAAYLSVRNLYRSGDSQVEQEIIKRVEKADDYYPYQLSTIKKWLAEGNPGAFHVRSVIDALRAMGYDGFVEMENGIKQYGVFNAKNIKSATGNRGTFDSGNPDIRFSRKPPGNNASWNAPEPSKIDNLIYKLQNKNIDLKRVMEAVRESGMQLAEKFDAYLQEELFHGRTAKRAQDFVNQELKPLIAGLRLRGLSIDELDKYLHARHAEEANALIAQRDPNMPDGGSGMTNAEAREYFKNLDSEKQRKLEQVAKKVDAIIAQTRDLYVSYGLIDQATADSWEKMFRHYVPLMREDKDGGMGIGQGFSIKGKEVKHRTGSTRAVVDILANIALQREKAIVRGEKNRVAVSLAGLAKLNPNPDFWTFDKIPTEKVLNEATGLVEERPVPNIKNRDNVVVAKIKDSKGS